MMRREQQLPSDHEDDFLDSADQDKVIAELRLHNAQSAKTYSFVFCLCALAHCLFVLYVLLHHFLVSPFPSPLCVFERPFKKYGLPSDVLAILLLSGVACSAYIAYSAQFIMRLPQRLAQRKLQGDCTPSCSFSLSSHAWTFVNIVLWVMVFLRTQVAPWDATGSFCISLAPVAITYGLHTLSKNTVKFDRSIDSLEGGKYEFKKL